jgi:DNA-binding CsgD family transcriptional regulator
MRRGIAELEAAVTAIDDLPEADRARTASPLVQWIGASINGIWLAGEVVMPGVMEGINPCQHTLIHWYALSGRLHESVAMGEDIIARATAVLRDGFPLQDVCYQGYLGLARAYMLLGQPDRARKWFALAHAALDALGHHALLLFSYLEELRLVLIFHGDRPHERRRLALDVFRTAQRAGQAHNANSRTFDNVYALVVDVLEGRSTLARKQGRPQLAWSWVRTMLPDGLDYEFGDCLFRCSSEMQRLAASLSLDAGDLDTARSWIEAHDRWLKWAKSIVGQAEGALLWARYYQQSGDLAQARRYADRALVVASEPPQQLMLIAAYRFLGQLAIQEGNLADAETHLSRSLTLTRACQIPYEEALTLLITAELRIATGNSTEALALLERVRQICEPMGAKLALDAATALEARLAGPTCYPAGLTPREVEVLRLIAAGRSNREMAADLFLSVRTVERHITNIYGKVDARTRAEATAYAFRNGLAGPAT